MKWFKKLFQKDTADVASLSSSQTRRPRSIKWFGSSARVENFNETNQLRNEIDVVPRTEITASRQALNNISLALNNVYGEPSGESTRKCHDGSKSKGCENKYCCGMRSKSLINIADSANESIKKYTTAENKQKSELEISSFAEKRTDKLTNELQVPSIYFESPVDYGKSEVTETSDSTVDIPCVAEESTSFYDPNYAVKTTPVDFNFYYNLEQAILERYYTLYRCDLSNYIYEMRHRSLGSGCRPDWKLEDFNDDNKSTRMHEDTKTIKKYYRLNTQGDILLHYHDIPIKRPIYSDGPERYTGCFGFISWLFIRGKEMKEVEVKEKKMKKLCLWIKKLFGIFKKKHPRNKVEHNDPGEGIESYTLSLALDETSVFAKNIHNFITCTRDSREKIPQKVMRNMRQFMNGMKNYLVKHGEKDFGIEVEKARAALKQDEFLNLDQILEGVMHQLVIMPLREHLNELFVDYYGSRGDIQLIINNMKYAENKDPTAFGVKKGLKTPSPQVLNRISMVFAKLQEAELPFEKLDHLLNAVTLILENTVDPESGNKDARHLGCDDFLPLFAYIICKCGFHFAEIEAEYMWGLLQPTLMIGQAGYYVTSLCSAAISLKELKSKMDQENGDGNAVVPNMPLECSVLRIIIPDEYNGSIQTKTIPVRPHTTTKDVCRIIAHKSQITNPMDYGLFKLVDGEETLLMDNDCPQEIRLASAGKHCMLAYKRFDAKIAWPKQ